MPADEAKGAEQPLKAITFPVDQAVPFVAELGLALWKARAVLNNESVNNRERRAITALLARLAFLVGEMWPDAEFEQSFLVLMRALRSLDGGAQDPLLTPFATGGRPRDFGLERLKGHVAGTIDLYMRCGQRKLEAARSASKALRKHGADLRPEKLLGWRKEASETAGERHDAYETIRQGALTGDTPAALKAIESMLAHAARGLRPKK